MKKSYVGMNTKVCPICGIKHDVGILLNRRLTKSLENQNIIGYELCPECKKHTDDGYIALIEVDNTDKKPNLKFREANRTGGLAFIKKDLFESMIHKKIDTLFVFVDLGVLERLKNNAS